jgi:hypothetical protein
MLSRANASDLQSVLHLSHIRRYGELERVLWTLMQRQEAASGFPWTQVPGLANLDELDSLAYAQGRNDPELFAYTLRSIKSRVAEDPKMAEAVERAAQRQQRRQQANFDWRRVPKEASGEELGLLLEAEQGGDPLWFDSTIAEIAVRLRAEADEALQAKEVRLAQKRKGHRRDRLEEYLPILKQLPPSIRNPTQAVVLGLFLRRNRRGLGMIAKHRSMRINTGTSEDQLKEALQHFSRHHLIQEKNIQEQKRRMNWPDGTQSTWWQVNVPFDPKTTPHYQLPFWLAERYEVTPTTKIGWGVVKDLACLQDTKRMMHNRCRFKARGADVAARMPIPISERTGQRILKDLVGWDLIRPDATTPYTYELNLDHGWRWVHIIMKMAELDREIYGETEQASDSGQN